MKTAPLTPPRRDYSHGVRVAKPMDSLGDAGVDPRWAWHYRTLSHLRDRILAAHADHATQVASAPERLGYESADTAREELDRDILWAELEAENNRLFEIDAALNRIRAGTYGTCEATGEPIGAARLRVIPWTRYCHDAAEAAEKRRHGATSTSD